MTKTQLQTVGDDLPNVRKNFASDFDDVSADERTTPTLVMLQSNSPQLSEDEPSYVEGARVGQILDVASGEPFNEVDVIVCGRNRYYTKWRPRALGGGILGRLSSDDPVVLDTLARLDKKYGLGGGRFHMPKYLEKDRRWSDEPALDPATGAEMELVETVEMFVVYGPPDELVGMGTRAIVRFKSTSLKTVKLWHDKNIHWVNLCRRQEKEPPRMWAIKWRLRTAPGENELGKYRVWRLDLAPPAKRFQDALYQESDPDLYAYGEESYNLYAGGRISVGEEREDEIPF
jgi:hypothetical protein